MKAISRKNKEFTQCPWEEMALGMLVPQSFRETWPSMLDDVELNRQWRHLLTRTSERIATYETFLKEDTPDCVEGHPMTYSNFLSESSLIALLSGRMDWIQTVIAFGLKLCDIPHWQHPLAGCITLVGRSVTRNLCIMTDRLWGHLNSQEKEKLLGALVAKGVENHTAAPNGVRNPGDDRGQLLLVRRLDPSDPHCLHPRTEQCNNWEITFSSTLYLIANLVEHAYLSDSEVKLDDKAYYLCGYEINRERINFWKTLAEERALTAMNDKLGQGGDYAEGPGYAAMGIEAFAIILDLIKSFENRDIAPAGFYHIPFWQREFYPEGPDTGMANFNDSTMKSRLNSEAFFQLAHLSGDPQLLAMAHESLRAQGGVANLNTLLYYQKPGASIKFQNKKSSHYEKTGSIFWRSGVEEAPVYFALQCGIHGGAHQHKDRGHYFLSAYGEHLAVGVGDCRYMEDKTPGPAANETDHHNVFLIDGQGQVGDNNKIVHGRIEKVENTEVNSFLQADMSACYTNAIKATRKVSYFRPDIFYFEDHCDKSVEKMTWLVQGNHIDGQGHWHIQGNEAVFSRPEASLLYHFIDIEPEFEILSGDLDGIKGGRSALHASFKAHAVRVIAIPFASNHERPSIQRQSEGLFIKTHHQNKLIPLDDTSGLQLND